MIVDQIYNCPYRGALRLRYLESKCMELVVRQLWETARISGAASLKPIKDRDRRQVHLARDILIQDLENPPSVKKLAKKSGMSYTGLKRGVRSVFGTTVHGYLRHHRLDRSREILASGRMNVDETAMVSLGWGHALPMDDILNSPNGRVIIDRFDIIEPDMTKTERKTPEYYGTEYGLYFSSQQRFRPGGRI